MVAQHYSQQTLYHSRHRIGGSPPLSVADPAQQLLFSAPRHATATFRLLFTSVSCLTAFSSELSVEEKFHGMRKLILSNSILFYFDSLPLS